MSPKVGGLFVPQSIQQIHTNCEKEKAKSEKYMCASLRKGHDTQKKKKRRFKEGRENEKLINKLILPLFLTFTMTHNFL